MSYLDRLKEAVSEKQAPMALQKVQKAPFYSFCSAQDGRVSEIETSDPVEQPSESADPPAPPAAEPAVLRPVPLGRFPENCPTEVLQKVQKAPLGPDGQRETGRLSPASEARRQKVLALQARSGSRYQALVEDASTDPVIVALATPDGTCELTISLAKHDPFEIVAMVDRWNSKPDPLSWRVSITEPGGRTVEVDTPSGGSLADWEAYALRHHGHGCTVTALRALPKPRAPVNLDDTLRAACEGVAGIAPAQFRLLLSTRGPGGHSGGRDPPQDPQGLRGTPLHHQ